MSRYAGESVGASKAATVDSSGLMGKCVGSIDDKGGYGVVVSSESGS